MFGLTISVFISIIVCVDGQTNYRNQFLRLDDANKSTSIPNDWDVEDPSIVTYISVSSVNVDKINTGAFTNFINLKELKLTGRITAIKDDAFTGMDKFERITLNGVGIQDIGPKVFHNLKSLKWLDVANNEIKEINLTNLTLLTELNLSNNAITELSNDTFVNLENLETIDLSENKILAIKSRSFIGYPGLTNLYLNKNQIANIEPSVWINLSNLEVLSLGHNNLTTMTEDQFGRLMNLKRLDLSHNKIKFFDMLLWSELTELRLDHNLITSLPKNIFAYTPKLEYLDLGFNLIKKIYLPNELDRLRRLNLKHNQLQSIELLAITQMNIEVLDLSYNNLTNLNESFQHLINLQELFLNNNKLKSFPLCIPGSLTHLVLAHNELHEIALEFCGSVTKGKLQRVYLSYNAITELNNNSFGNLPELIFIAMDNNKIRSIKSGTFSGCTNLTELYLYDNQLADIEPDAFRDLQKLELLTLRNNNLTTITPNHFKGLTSLKALYLSHNKFTSLDPFLLNNLTELTDISFNYNSITSLPEKFFNNTPKLKMTNFAFNLLKEFHLYDNLVHLIGVYLQYNQIQSIKLSAAVQNNIFFINLNANNLTHLDESFQHLINLQKLYLNKNIIKSFPLCIPGNLTHLHLSHNKLKGIALDKFCGSATQGKLQIVKLSSNQFTSYNLTYTNKSLQETQPDLNEIDLNGNFLNADSVKLIQNYVLNHVAFLKIEPQQKNDVKNSCNESMYKEGNTTWIVVTSAALAAVGVFAVIAAILFVCKQRRRTNPNVNDAVMLDELYDDVRGAPFYDYPTFPIYDYVRGPHIYHYPRFRPWYDEVRPQPVYLSVLPDIPGPQQLEEENREPEPEENIYEEID